MYFPLSLWDFSLWTAVTSIILLVTSEVLVPYSGYFGYLIIDKTRLRIAALAVGLAFMITVALRVVTPA